MAQNRGGGSTNQLAADPHSNPWKVYKRVVKGDSNAHITAERMRWRLTDIGTRAG